MIEDYLNKIIEGDCVAVLRALPEGSVDLIFTDPPYNLQLKNELLRPNQTRVDAVNDEWDRFASFEEYDEFTYDWLKECRRVLKKDGAIWVIGSYHNIYRVGKIIQDLGYWILNDVIWVKTNPMPNFRGTRFNNAQETLIWAAREEKSKYTFHYKTMKAYNDDLQMRSDWYIPICSGPERTKVNGEKAHSTQKPEELLYRLIISTSNPGDIILDPFMGSGTTGAVAKKLGRNYIGIEREEEYIAVARERIANVAVIADDLLRYPLDARRPRVPFGNLLEVGLLRPGDLLFSRGREFRARVLANATIECNEIVGSIHSVSARLLDKPANNGWKFWYYGGAGGGLRLLDELREEYIGAYL